MIPLLRHILILMALGGTLAGCAMSPEMLERQREQERQHRYWFPYDCQLPYESDESNPVAENQCGGGVP